VIHWFACRSWVLFEHLYRSFSPVLQFQRVVPAWSISTQLYMRLPLYSSTVVFKLGVAAHRWVVRTIFRGVASRYLLYTAVLQLFYLSFKWGSCHWVIVGCCNGSQYKNVENHCSSRKYFCLRKVFFHVSIFRKKFSTFRKKQTVSHPVKS